MAVGDGKTEGGPRIYTDERVRNKPQIFTDGYG